MFPLLQECAYKCGMYVIQDKYKVYARFFWFFFSSFFLQAIYSKKNMKYITYKLHGVKKKCKFVTAS